jgi:hypothetical protein
MVDHTTYVQICHPRGFFAVCTTCGSEGFPNHDLLIEAERDATEHGTLKHIYSYDELLDHEQSST